MIACRVDGKQGHHQKSMQEHTHTHTTCAFVLPVFQPQAGCSQSLFQHGATQGSVNVVLGPSAASGVTTAISHRCERTCLLHAVLVRHVRAVLRLQGAVGIGVGSEGCDA
eukprot:scaffold16048_cov21-Tisochrysis_lutea.AAC.2